MTQACKYVYIYIICMYHIYQNKNLAKGRMMQKNRFNIPKAVIKIISKVKVMQVKKYTDLLTRQSDPLLYNG